jgi:catechol-2,3-dioxygenase
MSPAKLSHIVLRTNNSKTIVQFYKTFLGATLSFESELFCFITYDDEHHRIGILNLPGIGKKNTEHSGLEHIAFTFKNLNNLALSYLQRKHTTSSHFDI